MSQQVRFSGSYMLPWAIQLSANYQARNGAYWARTAVFRGGVTIPSITLRVEPRDANEYPTIQLTDFRVEKRLRLGGVEDVGAAFQRLQPVQRLDHHGQTVASGPSFGSVTAITRGRLGEFNVAFNF